MAGLTVGALAAQRWAVPTPRAALRALLACLAALAAFALVAPRPLQCQNGLLEPPTQFIVPLAREALREIRPIYADLGAPGRVALDVHGGGHEIDLPALLAFFEERLDPGRPGR
jgi:hypothetical protein